ncbi:MAG TPA: hypothetical protein VNA25_02225 [Phycisphaerae bacterium]|nr:hypothetical protein [Phycisphaerae bacterium]
MERANVLLSVVALAFSVVSLFYAIRVNRRLLKVGRANSRAKLQVLVRNVQEFGNWLSHDAPQKPFDFAFDVGWDHAWHILFEQVEDYYRREDRELIQKTRETMFQMYRALRRERVMPENPFRDRPIEECRKEFACLQTDFNAIRPKRRIWLWP